MIDERGKELGQAINTAKFAVECGTVEGEGDGGRQLEKLLLKSEGRASTSDAQGAQTLHRVVTRRRSRTMSAPTSRKI